MAGREGRGEIGGGGGTTWWPSGELSLPPLLSRMYGAFVLGEMHFWWRASMRLHT